MERSTRAYLTAYDADSAAVLMTVPELAEYFVAGEDFVYFESDEDLLAKAEYFLIHENERKEIADNGWRKIQAAFSYDKKLLDIFSNVVF